MGDSTKKRKKPSETEVLVANDKTVSADASTSLTEVVKTKKITKQKTKRRESQAQKLSFLTTKLHLLMHHLHQK